MSHQPSAISHERRGFTFVELLIAATMMSILIAGMGAHLHGGVSLWRRVTTTGEATQRQRVAMDRLARELANAVIYDDRAAAYGDEDGTLPRPQFEDAAMAYFTIAQPPRQALPAVRMVTYRCDVHDGTQGLWRTSQSIGEARARRAPNPELLLPDCAQLALRYTDLAGEASQPVEWRSQWPDAEASLPRLVEVTIQLTSGRHLMRRLAIPAARGYASASPS